MRSWRQYFIMVLMLMSGMVLANGDPHQETAEAISQTAKTFLTAQVAGQVNGRLEIEVGHLDPRITLTPCSTDLEAYLSPGSQALHATTVGVSCRGTVPWSMYVPVKVQVFNTVIIAAQPIANGLIIGASDIAYAEKDTAGLSNGFFQSADQVMGKEVRTNIMVGNVIASHDVKAPQVVSRGDVVVIAAHVGSLMVTGQGVAMDAGARGDLIRVKNKNSLKIVNAQITGPNQVEVPMASKISENR